MKRTGLLIASLVLAGCAVPPGYYDPYDPYYDPYGRDHYAEPRSVGEGADTAQAICSIDSLTTARNEMRSEIERAGYDRGYSGYGRSYDSRDRARVETRATVTERPYGPQTETVELVHAFESDLDAAYRFATSSCQSYQMCMQHQGYQETACMSSAQQWQDARRDFTALSGRLAEIRLDITQTMQIPAPHHRPYRRSHNYDRGCQDRYCGDRYYDNDCDSVLGDVFTTSTCDYPRRRSYRRY